MKLRAPLTGAVLLAFLVAVPAGAHRHRPDHVIASLGAQWDSRNADGAANLFEEDGVLFYSDASYIKGRGAIRDFFQALFESNPTLQFDEGNLNYHQPGHWASIDRKARLTVEHQTTDVIVSAVVTQTKDGPGVEECRDDRPNEPCDEWSLVSLWIVKDSSEPD
jgi:ketosteroid isomerase-like protein